MLHACVRKFDVTDTVQKNLGTKQGLYILNTTLIVRVRVSINVPRRGAPACANNQNLHNHLHIGCHLLLPVFIAPARCSHISTFFETQGTTRTEYSEMFNIHLQDHDIYIYYRQNGDATSIF